MSICRWGEAAAALCPLYLLIFNYIERATSLLYGLLLCFVFASVRNGRQSCTCSGCALICVPVATCYLCQRLWRRFSQLIILSGHWMRCCRSQMHLIWCTLVILKKTLIHFEYFQGAFYIMWYHRIRSIRCLRIFPLLRSRNMPFLVRLRRERPTSYYMVTRPNCAVLMPLVVFAFCPI